MDATKVTFGRVHPSVAFALPLIHARLDDRDHLSSIDFLSLSFINSLHLTLSSPEVQVEDV